MTPRTDTPPATLLDHYERVVAPAQPLATTVPVVRAQGAWLETADGRRLLDGTSGIATVNLGHDHPRVRAAAQEQLERLCHTGGVFMAEPMVELAERLAHVTPGEIGSFLFATSGAEAIEVAIKLARHTTGRPGVVVFSGGFHGRTLGALSCSTVRAVQRVGHGPPGVGVHVAPFPRPRPGGAGATRAAERALRALDELHRQQLAPSETACYLVEPVQGYGGCHPAGRRFLEGLRARADRHGALLVVDEIQTRFGRTGALFGADRDGVVPDLICLAKAIANGLPLSCVGGAPGLMARWPAGAHGSTFGGSPVACAAACAVLDTLVREGIPARARALGARARARLAPLVGRLPALADVRGPGLMIGLELADPDGRARPDLAAAAVATAEEAGLLVMRSGSEGNVIRFLPPLTLADWELEVALGILEGALWKAAGEPLPRVTASLVRAREPRPVAAP